MQHITLRKTLGLSLLALLVCTPARAQQQNSQQSGTGDPVADAARKAQEKKKDAPKPKKVYTEDDISVKKSDISIVGTAPVQADSSAASVKTNPAEAKADPNDKAQQKEDPNSEKAWRARFDALRTKIAAAEQELDVLQREENKADVQYYSDPTKALKEQYTREDINKKAAKIDAKQKQIAALKQQWDDLEDALRKAGGNPGWAR
jgi:chromosome segregation ATPase